MPPSASCCSWSEVYASAAVRGTRDALALLGSDDRLDATAVQTIGSKGWDGFAFAVVK